MHEFFMQSALDLARKGTGLVHPNPLVGAVLVRDGEIIGRGFHAFYGGPHAEVMAIDNAILSGNTDFSNTTLYVTLEPCCHFGKTPPCTSLILNSGIRSVVVGMEDPNPLVAGKGIRILKEAGIDVEVGILEAECRELNRVFITYITTGKPFVLLKSGLSLDGKISTASGESRWISCEESRKDVHRLRSEYMAIMCGIETVLSDDPALTVRMIEGRNPTRIIADSHLRIPMDSNIVTTAHKIKTIIATTEDSDTAKAEKLKDAGVHLIYTRQTEGHVDLQELMTILGQMEIDSILLEGGGTLAFSALKAGIVNAVRFYMAPVLLGGQRARTVIAGEGFSALADACKIENIRIGSCGSDILIEGTVCSPA